MGHHFPQLQGPKKHFSNIWIFSTYYQKLEMSQQNICVSPNYLWNENLNSPLDIPQVFPSLCIYSYYSVYFKDTSLSNILSTTEHYWSKPYHGSILSTDFLMKSSLMYLALVIVRILWVYIFLWVYVLPPQWQYTFLEASNLSLYFLMFKMMPSSGPSKK